MSTTAAAASTCRRTGAGGTAPPCMTQKSPSRATPAPASTRVPTAAPKSSRPAATATGAPPAGLSIPSATSSREALMTTISTTTDSFASALAQFQAELPVIEKTAAAIVQGEKDGRKYTYGYHYADLAAITAIALP